MLEESVLPKDLMQASKAAPFVNLSALPPAEKQRAWNHLKRAHPATASLLADMRSDDQVNSIIEKFGASICIERTMLKGMIAQRESNTGSVHMQAGVQ